MLRRLILIVALMQIALLLPAKAEDMRPAQALAQSFLDGDAAGIWARALPEMQAVFGSMAAIEQFHAALMQDFGTEQEVLSEQIDAQGDYTLYTRVSRWSGYDTPLEMVLALDPEARIAGLHLRPQPVAAPSRYMDYETRAPLRLPVNGAWFVYWGGRTIAENYHAVDPGQRFAIDLLVMEEGQSYAGDPAQVENYHCWDRPVLAPAPGRVVSVVDGLPDQAIGQADPRNPAGNHVVVDFGHGEFGFLAHLRQGSVAVSEGQPVAAGQVLGRCGNSGNSTEPHLHFHLQTSPYLGEGEGLPAQFRRYLADGRLIDRGEPLRGETIRPAD